MLGAVRRSSGPVRKLDFPLQTVQHLRLGWFGSSGAPSARGSTCRLKPQASVVRHHARTSGSPVVKGGSGKGRRDGTESFVLNVRRGGSVLTAEDVGSRHSSPASPLAGPSSRPSRSGGVNGRHPKKIKVADRPARRKKREQDKGAPREWRSSLLRHMHGAEAAQDDVQQVGVLAKRLASKGKGKELLELIRGIRTAGIAVAEALPLQAVVTQLCRHGSTEQVLEVVEALSVDEGLEPWATAMRVYCSWGWTRSAERLMLALEAHGRLEPSEAMLCDLMQAYRQQLGSSKCMKYFRRIEQMQTPSMALCNGLLEAHSGSLEEAMPVFEHLSKQQCFQPNTASFNLLLKAAARTAHEGAAEAALEVVEGMKEVDVRPNKDTFVRLSLVLSRWKRREDVLRLPLQIQEAGLAVEEDLWAALMIAHGRCEALEAAWVLWMDLRHRLPTRPRERTYQSLMNACCEAFQGHRCLPLLQELEGLEGGASEHSYNIAIKGCMPSPGTKASEEQLARAVQLKDRMLAAGRRPSVVTWTSLLDLCASCGQGATALVLYREMLAQDDRVVPDCGMYTCLIKALGSAGMLQEALDVYDEMLQPSVAAPPPQPQRRLRQQAAKPVLRSKPTYITMIRACRLHGDLESALRVYNDMRLQGFAPSNHELNALLQDCAEVQLQAQGSGADAPPSEALANMSQLAGRPPAPLPGLLRAGVAGPLRLVASAAGRGEGSRAAASGEGAADACAGRERMADIVAPLQPTLLGQFDKEAEKVDLHDLSAVEARAAVLYVLRSLYHRVLEGGGRPRKDLVIITGAGRHSLDCRPRIREAIQRLFQELQISLQQAGERVPEPSSPPASGRRGRGTQALQRQRQPEVQQNPGRLVVTSRELNRWIDSRMK